MVKWGIAVVIGCSFLLACCTEPQQIKDEKKLDEPKEPAKVVAPTITTGDVKVDTKAVKKVEKKVEKKAVKKEEKKEDPKKELDTPK